MKTATPKFAALLAAAALALSACASTSGTTTPPSGNAVAEASTLITISDAWVKSAASEMSAAFGVVNNAGPEDITVVSASSESAHMIELHETVESESGETIMREIAGGFTIPAGGSLLLEPGGNHLMLMGLPAPLSAGEQTEITLTFGDGSTLKITAPVKDYSGANENYQPSEHGDESGH